MNRKEEYQALRNELEQTPVELEYTMTRVQARVRKKKTGRTLRLFGIPVASIGGLLMAFALLVNFSLPVALACMNVPVLKELMAAVAFSDSLKTMIENDFVQPVGVTKAADGAEMTIHYLVYDGTEINIFYNATYNGSSEIEVFPDYTHPDGSDMGATSWSTGLPPKDGEMGHMSVGIHNGGEFPSAVKLTAEFYPRDGYYSGVVVPIPAPESSGEWENPAENRQEREPVAVLEFDLTLEEKFIKAKRTYTPNAEADLAGRILTVEEVTVYPTGTRLVIRESEENDAELSGLEMWLEDGGGKRVEQGKNGLISSGGSDEFTTNYFMNSVYFEPDDHLTLCIAQADWLEKGKETATLDLVSYETGGLPEGITLTGVERNGDDVKLTFLDQVSNSSFAGSYFTPDGEEHYFNRSGNRLLDEDEFGRRATEVYCYLWNYTWDTVEIGLHWNEIVDYEPVIRVPLG